MDIIWHQFVGNLLAVIILIALLEGIFRHLKKKDRKIIKKFNAKSRGTYYLIIIVSLFFFSSPFRMTQENYSAQERSFVSDIDLPPRVVVETEAFDDYNTKSLETLRKQNKEHFNETISQ